MRILKAVFEHFDYLAHIETYRHGAKYEPYYKVTGK